MYDNIVVETPLTRIITESYTHNFYQINRIQGYNWSEDYYDIAILETNKEYSKESRKLESLYSDKGFKCCLEENKEIYSAMNGIVRAIYYYQEDRDRKPDFMYVIYEGQARNGDKDGFGRLIYS